MDELCVSPNWSALGVILKLGINNFILWLVDVCYSPFQEKETYSEGIEGD